MGSLVHPTKDATSAIEAEEIPEISQKANQTEQKIEKLDKNKPNIVIKLLSGIISFIVGLSVFFVLKLLFMVPLNLLLPPEAVSIAALFVFAFLIYLAIVFTKKLNRSGTRKSRIIKRLVIIVLGVFCSVISTMITSGMLNNSNAFALNYDDNFSLTDWEVREKDNIKVGVAITEDKNKSLSVYSVLANAEGSGEQLVINLDLKKGEFCTHEGYLMLDLTINKKEITFPYACPSSSIYRFYPPLDNQDREYLLQQFRTKNIVFLEMGSTNMKLPLSTKNFTEVEKILSDFSIKKGDIPDEYLQAAKERINKTQVINNTGIE